MEKHLRVFNNRVIQIVLISLLALSIDYLIVIWCNDDSIWLGEAIEAVASIMCGPVVGFFGTFIGCITTDYLIYGSLEYSFVAIFEASSMALIGVIYRSLIKDEDKFGVREIVVFNFIQILVNTAVLYFSTPPAGVLFFGFITKDWTKADFIEEMADLGNNTFSACISVALIGTVLLKACTVIRREFKEQGSLAASFRSILEANFINREYRTRALEYSIGFIFAVALTMVDGVVSGQVLGQDALAATSIMFPLVSLSTFISTIITSGCSNLCAIAKGDGDYERSQKLFTLGFFATIFLGVLQTVLFYFTESIFCFNLRLLDFCRKLSCIIFIVFKQLCSNCLELFCILGRKFL